MDTTATNTLAAYDRIVLWGEALSKIVHPGSAGVYRYDADLGISQDVLLQVSDHYPVWCSFKSIVHPTLKKYVRPMIGLILEDRRLPKLDYIQLISSFRLAKFKGQLSRIEIRSQKLSRVAD